MKRILILTAILMMAATTAMATPWQNSNEISVAEAYNTLWNTNYDENTMEGLTALKNDHKASNAGRYNTSDYGFLRVEAWDSHNHEPLIVRYSPGGCFNFERTLFDPEPMTGDSRGWQPNGSEFINLVDLLGDDMNFYLYVGNDMLNSFSTVALSGGNDDLLIGYNEGKYWGGDKDFNEPIVHLSKTPIPGAVWLLGSGLMGLLGLRRKRS